MDQKIAVNGAGYEIKKLLGHGKGGYSYLEQVREMAERARNAGLNIDYFPTNFVVQNQLQIWHMRVVS